MNKFKKIGWRGAKFIFVLFVVLLVAQPALAGLILTLGDIKDQNSTPISNITIIGAYSSYIQAFHQERDPDDDTDLILVADDGAEYDTNASRTLPTFEYHKYIGYILDPETFQIQFSRSGQTPSPGGTIWFRVWNGTPNSADSYYSEPISSSVGTLSPVDKTLNAKTGYKAAAPYKPIITQVEENNIEYTDGPPVQKIKIVFRQPTWTEINADPDQTLDGDREVTLAELTWREVEDHSVNGTATTTDLFFDLTVGEGNFNPETGTQYEFVVKQRNWFDISAASDSAFYTYQGETVAGSAAEPVMITFDSGSAAGLPGFNSFSWPLPANETTGKWYIWDPAGPDGPSVIDFTHYDNSYDNSISGPVDLIYAINHYSGGNYVDSFGTWLDGLRPQKASGVVIAEYGGSTNLIISETFFGLGDNPSWDLLTFDQTQGYQLYIGKKKPNPGPTDWLPAPVSFVIYNQPTLPEGWTP